VRLAVRAARQGANLVELLVMDEHRHVGVVSVTSSSPVFALAEEETPVLDLPRAQAWRAIRVALGAARAGPVALRVRASGQETTLHRACPATACVIALVTGPRLEFEEHFGGHPDCLYAASSAASATLVFAPVRAPRPLLAQWADGIARDLGLAPAHAFVTPVALDLLVDPDATRVAYRVCDGAAAEIPVWPHWRVR